MKVRMKMEKGTRGEGSMGEVKGFREHISENTEVTAQMLRAGVNAEGGQWDLISMLWMELSWVWV